MQVSCAAVLLLSCLVLLGEAWQRASSLGRLRKPVLTLRSRLAMNKDSLYLGGKESEGEEGAEEEADDIFGKPVGPLPTVSSRTNFADDTPRNVKYDLWIVGAGTLGELIAKQYRALHPHAKIIAETRSTTRHEYYRSLGVIPRLRSEREAKQEEQEVEHTARQVVICLPPSSSSDFDAELSDGCRLWAGPMAGGRLVYTSSIGVYGEANGQVVDESFRLDSRTASSTKLIAAEEAVILRGGSIVRLAGLYNDHRGPHSYYLRLAKEGKTLPTNEDGLINLLHYEDAARLVLAILHGPQVEKGKGDEEEMRIFIGADDEPVSRKELVSSALASGLFPDCPTPHFEHSHGAIGKRVDDCKTRQYLGWKPSYPSFRKYMRELGGEVVPAPPTREELKKAHKKEKSALWLPGDDDLGELNL